MVRDFLFILLWIFGCQSFGQSVFSEGDWYKVGVTATGIYKIDANTLIVLGIDQSTIDPRNLKLFGSGIRGMLPQENALSRPSDPQELAIFISGEADGRFDDQDYLLFYGLGPHTYQWNEQGEFEFLTNIYSDTTYYFLNVSDSPGKRISISGNPSQASEITIRNFDDAITYENNKVCIIFSGRNWLGETLFDGEKLSFNYLLEGVTSDINLTTAVANRSSGPGIFEVIANGSSLGSIEVESIDIGPEATYDVKAKYQSFNFNIESVENLSLELRFSSQGGQTTGHQDFHYLTFQRKLKIYGQETHFRSIESIGKIAEYQLLAANQASVWNVTDPLNISAQELLMTDNTASFIDGSDQLQEFVAFEGTNFENPFIFGRLANQNLKSGPAVDGLIVTHSDFFSEAQRLADFHAMHDGLSVKVVEVRAIYNEFSSGRQDITAIRDYAKFLYETGGKLKYLLLFGDCSYDYKNRVVNNTNFVPTYESRESFDPVFTYSSDDYYGFLETNEGKWDESFSGDHTLDIGVGRLPAKTYEEAKLMVDKIINYSTNPKTLGKWKTEFTYVVDDGDRNGHMRDSENLSSILDTHHPKFRLNKIFLDAYPQVEGATSESSPATEAALSENILDGTFVMNFMGHGNESQWMHEEILSREMIRSFNNRNKLPLFVTATCEFGRYDNPAIVSGAEELLLNKNGGAIALLTTSRPVYQSSNYDLNEAFHNNIFKRINGEYMRLGEIVRRTKNEGLSGPNNRNFTLLGDPMMKLAFPDFQIVLDQRVENDTLSALEKVVFRGEIQNKGTLVSGFNGVLSVRFNDVPQEFLTIGQESDPFTYLKRTNFLFQGEASVTNGRFEFSFVVPKNISYAYENCKLSMYAMDEENNWDADGESNQLLIGGTSSAISIDNTPPVLNMFLNDESFINGAIVGRSPLLLASVSDENGISASSSGVVEGISLKVNNEVYTLNDYYYASKDDYTTGNIVFPIPTLDPGKYSATLKMYDTFNNSTSQTIEFTVSDGPLFNLYDAKLFPNPVSTQATFSFRHDRVQEDIKVDFLVYNTQGKLLSRQEYLAENSNRTIEINWTPRSENGFQLNNGIYFYKAIIKSLFDGAKTEYSNRILISQ